MICGKRNKNIRSKKELRNTANEMKDFYNIDDRWLGSYFEKEWFDQIILQNADQY